MSNSDKERSTVSSGECGSGGDDDEDDGKQNQNQNQNQREGHRYRRRVKQAVMFPFRKPKKQQQQPPTYHNSAYCSGSSATKKASRSRGKGHHIHIGCCYLCCMKQPPTLESPPPFDSHRSDPNNPDVFSYESFKSLIENNVFYSKECNPHTLIDI